MFLRRGSYICTTPNNLSITYLLSFEARRLFGRLKFIQHSDFSSVSITEKISLILFNRCCKCMRLLINIRNSVMRICGGIWHQCTPNCDVRVTWWRHELEFRYSAPTLFRRVRKNCLKQILGMWCLSIFLSFRREQLGSYSTNPYEIWYLNIFRKSVQKIKVSSNSEKNNGYFMWGPVYIYYHISLNSS